MHFEISDLMVTVLPETPLLAGEEVCPTETTSPDDDVCKTETLPPDDSVKQGDGAEAQSPTVTLVQTTDCLNAMGPGSGSDLEAHLGALRRRLEQQAAPGRTADSGPGELGTGAPS